MDWLHISDLGVAADFIGNFFHEVLQFMPGENKDERCTNLYLEILAYYEAHGISDRFDCMPLTFFEPKDGPETNPYPLQDSTTWAPPYSYVPTHPNMAPAFFTHPRYTPDFQFDQPRMDPAVAPEVISMRTGIPLEQTLRAMNNRHVRDMTDQMHVTSVFRTGDREAMPVPAYGP